MYLNQYRFAKYDTLYLSKSNVIFNLSNAPLLPMMFYKMKYSLLNIKTIIKNKYECRKVITNDGIMAKTAF